MKKHRYKKKVHVNVMSQILINKHICDTNTESDDNKNSNDNKKSHSCVCDENTVVHLSFSLYRYINNIMDNFVTIKL